MTASTEWPFSYLALDAGLPAPSADPPGFSKPLEAAPLLTRPKAALLVFDSGLFTENLAPRPDYNAGIAFPAPTPRYC